MDKENTGAQGRDKDLSSLSQVTCQGDRHQRKVTSGAVECTGKKQNCREIRCASKASTQPELFLPGAHRAGTGTERSGAGGWTSRPLPSGRFSLTQIS